MNVVTPTLPIRPSRRAGRLLARTSLLAAAAALALSACTSGQPQPGQAQPGQGTGAPTASDAATPSSAATPSATDAPLPGAPADGGTSGPSGATGDKATFEATPPPRASGSAPDAGACAMLREADVRAALGASAPATLTPFAREDKGVEGFPGAVARECVMKLGDEPGHTVSVVVSTFPDAAAAGSYGVAPKGFTADPVAGVGDSAVFVENPTPVEVGYYVFAGRGADVIRYRIGKPRRGAGGPVAMDAATARDALVKLAQASGL